MITGELKNKVDSIWDTIWTGGITSPITVLEQITYLIFMKLLDDNQLKAEANANALGVKLNKKVFGEGICVISENPRVETDYKNLRWNVFHNFEPSAMLDNIQRYVFPFIKQIGEGKDTAFSRYMENTVFLIVNSKVLAKVVDGIDAMDMNNKDIMGDVYEYLLGKIAAAGENGQFRTPRHIIKMIVELMKPTLKDRILDPAMESAGFLLEASSYISEHYPSELMKKENTEHYKTKMFTGFDTDKSMLRIGAMNMMLHGVENPNITYQDSLSGDNIDRNCFSLIMANPPFTGSVFQDEISKDLLSLTKTKKTELLFMSLFTKMLETGGRCASIVPDGVLFGSSTAHKAIRKELVDKQKLTAVISMPSGVFKPYAGVSTAIVIFTKTNSGGTIKYGFMISRSSIEMKNKTFRPEIVDDKISISEYDTVFVGFPIWWYVAPTIINTFLESHDFSGKTVVVFATSGSSDFGNTINELKISLPDSTKLIGGKVLNGKYTNKELSDWAESIGV